MKTISDCVNTHTHTHRNQWCKRLTVAVTFLLLCVTITTGCKKEYNEPSAETVSPTAINNVAPKQFPDDEVLKNPEGYIEKIHQEISKLDEFINSSLRDNRGDSLVHKSDARILIQGLGNYRHDDFSTEIERLEKIKFNINLPVFVQGNDTLTYYSDISTAYSQVEYSLDSLRLLGEKVYSVSLSELSEMPISGTVLYQVVIQLSKSSAYQVSGYLPWDEADEAMNYAYRPYKPSPGEYWAYHSPLLGRTTNQFLESELATNGTNQYYGSQPCQICNGLGYLFNSVCYPNNYEPYINMVNYNQLRHTWVDYMENLYNPGRINTMDYISYETAPADPIIIANYPCYPSGPKHHLWEFKISYLAYVLNPG